MEYIYTKYTEEWWLQQFETYPNIPVQSFPSFEDAVPVDVDNFENKLWKAQVYHCTTICDILLLLLLRVLE